MKDASQQPWKFLSGSALKILAVFCMLTDHVACYLLADQAILNDPLFRVGETSVTILYLLRTVGRLAFPLYCFLLTEGFVYTSNRKKYGISLAVFALLSELPWNFVHSGVWLYETQNVFFTLLLGYLALCLIEVPKKQIVWEVLGFLLIFSVSYVLEADYGYLGVAVIIAMYLLRKHALPRAAVCTCLRPATWRAGLAFIPIAFYNGERGCIRGKVGKYFFYAFYPLHLLMLGIIKYCI